MEFAGPYVNVINHTVVYFFPIFPDEVSYYEQRRKFPKFWVEEVAGTYTTLPPEHFWNHIVYWGGEGNTRHPSDPSYQFPSA